MTEDSGLSSPGSVEQDIAWADSCLRNDVDIAGSGWDSFKDALLETLDAQNYERENPPEEDKMEIFSNGNTGNINKAKVKTGVTNAASSEGADSIEDSRKHNSQYHSSSSKDIKDLLDSDDTPDTFEEAESQSEDFWSTHKMERVFLPTYDESLKDLGISDPEPDFVFQEFQMEQITEDIFKIWDFDIPQEENELSKQLNKAVAEISSEPTPDNLEAIKGLEDVALDDLISGIESLVLNPNSD